MGRTVAQGLANDGWVHDIARTLTVHVQLLSDMPDKFIWKWTSDQCFSSAYAYQAFLLDRLKSRAPNV